MTSQIFANIYLNEFDRYVRQHLNPHAYIRYGDDFALFLPTKAAALHAQSVGTNWLASMLRLPVHPKNNHIFKARHGLFFLGHRIYPNTQPVIDRAMRAKITRQIDARNANSYTALYLPRKLHTQVPWLLAQKEEIV